MYPMRNVDSLQRTTRLQTTDHGPQDHRTTGQRSTGLRINAECGLKTLRRTKIREYECTDRSGTKFRISNAQLRMSK
jgi:hypothetical protein